MNKQTLHPVTDYMADWKDDVLKSKKRIAAAFLVSLILLFAGFESYADGKEVSKQEQQKEILVARDVSLDSPVWCGNNALVVSSERLGLRWTNLLNNKTGKIHSSAYVGAVDCSHDAEWLVYVDTRSSRWDKGSYERGVVDFWRYNIKTGKHQKFAIAEGGGKWSPDGKKFLFYGSKPTAYIEQPEPKWNLIWSQKYWPSGQGFEVAWLADSYSVIIINNDKVYIERYKEGESVQLQQLNVDLGDINHLKVDRHNRIYLLARSKQPNGLRALLRCQIADDSLQCEDILKRNKSIAVGGYAITQDGRNIIFIEEGKTWKEKRCVWLLKEGGEPKCITPSAIIRSTINISPNGKWMTFLRPRKIRDTDVYTDDLFLISLINE